MRQAQIMCVYMTVEVSNMVLRYTHIRPRPNYRNMSTQHIAAFLGAAYCVRLATVLRHVGCCFLKFLKWSDLSQQHPTRRNMSQ